jgi:DNA gyrase subunit A
VYEIPVASRTSKGKSIHNFLTIPPEEKISAIIAYANEETKAFLVMATSHGVMKKTPLKDFGNVRKTGIIALRLKGDDLLKWVKLSSGDDEIILVTSHGQAIRFKERDVRPMGRAATGIKAIRLKGADTVAGLDIISKDRKGENILVVMANGFGKQTPLKDYKTQKRGGGGIKTAKVTEKTGPVIAANIIGEDIKETLAFSSKGQALKSSLKDIRVAGRATQGVRIMNLEKGDKLIGIICL